MEYRDQQQRLARPYRDPEIEAREQHIFDQWLAGLPGNPPAPKDK